MTRKRVRHLTRKRVTKKNPKEEYLRKEKSADFAPYDAIRFKCRNTMDELTICRKCGGTKIEVPLKMTLKKANKSAYVYTCHRICQACLTKYNHIEDMVVMTPQLRAECRVRLGVPANPLPINKEQRTLFAALASSPAAKYKHRKKKKYKIDRVIS